MDINVLNRALDDLESDDGEPGLQMLGKRSSDQVERASEFNPLNAMMIHNLNQSHNTQRRRDIKTNYKAKLPLDKLEIEHEKKKAQVKEFLEKRNGIMEKIKSLWERIGIKNNINIDFDISFLTTSDDPKIEIPTAIENPMTFKDQTEEFRKNQGKTHWDFLMKEMGWMADDFEKESKKKQGDAKKMARNARKHIHEKEIAQEKAIREQKVELKRKSKFMCNIV